MKAAGDTGWAQFLRVSTARAGVPALIEADRVTDFATLREAAAGFALAGPLAPIQPGERVILWSANSAAMAAAILATWARGGIPVLLAATTALRQVAHAAATTDAALILAEPPRVAAAQKGTGRPTAALEPVAEAGAGEVAHAALLPDDPASILFTSGSTGLPKGVVQSHRNLRRGCDAVAESLGLARDDRVLCGVPWGFDYGWGQLLSTLFLGVTQVLPAAPDALAVCAAIHRHRPTVLAAVPALLAGMFQGVSGIERTDLSSVRMVTNTGSRIPPAVFQDLVGYFPAAELRLNYGLTETYRTSTLDPRLARRHAESVGRAIPGVGIAIVDLDGQSVASGAVGEVVHRGDGVFLGYWGDPAATARVRRPDPLWRHSGIAPPPAVFTGDLGRFDEDGLLHLVGRRDRQLKSMGVRVSPEEIEAMLLESGLVREAAVLSRPHATVGDLVVAVVAPSAPGTDPTAALKTFARGEMSPYLQPREYWIVDALPRTVAGKVDYPALRDRFVA